MDNKKVDEVVMELCDEIKGVMRAMRRANNTGDDVRVEIDSGLNLLTSAVGEIIDQISRKAA
ncbi:hypothetical protein [Vibrio furnissii]|uniref:hypothetical protein n=1 Tax=Vibrio furnissii TaxID=29494 RepID=UPI001EE9E785|nr:hypothetical protein [Vibrio furnissii]MCG6268278.1 hypothetical protein [Vibrio furnissii]